MSAGRILTVGLGTPFSAVKYLVTLGYGTAGIPPIPVVTTGGAGAGRPIYKRRKWREIKDTLEEGLQEAYADLLRQKLPPGVVTEAASLVKPFADKEARRKTIPRRSEIDWEAMARDAELARQLIDIHARYVTRIAFERLLEDEDEFLMMH